MTENYAIEDVVVDASLHDDACSPMPTMAKSAVFNILQDRIVSVGF